MSLRRLVLAAAGIAGLVTVLAPPAVAHPLGNFSLNTYAGLVVRPNQIAVDYVVDMAEIPALQARQRIDVDGNGSIDASEERRYREGRCAELARGLGLRLAGRSVALGMVGTSLSFPPGVANLLTLRLECRLAAPADVGSRLVVSFVDRNFKDRIGWREVTATGEGTRLRSTVPAVSVSSRLTSYPENRLQSPLSIRQGSLTASLATGRRLREPAQLAGVSQRGDRATSAFASLIEKSELSTSFVFAALAIAAGLGMLHAFAPGHGKTVMAAYLVGQRGVWREGLLIATTVAVTHTVGVAALGILISVSDALAPEALYPWLGIASGLLFAGVGLGLLLRSRGRHGRRPAGHAHIAGVEGHSHLAEDAGDDRDEHPHRPPAQDSELDLAPAEMAKAGALFGVSRVSRGVTVAERESPGRRLHRPPPAPTRRPARPGHRHDAPRRQPAGDGGGDGDRRQADGDARTRRRSLGRRNLVTLGLAGGLVPSPSAVIVLLAAIALGRAPLGVALVIAYGVGMAAVLVGIGFLLMRTRDRLERRLDGRIGGGAQRLARMMPTVTASLVIVGGLAVAVRAAGGL